jgi:ABC-type multidrug transport system ATPase subunit
MKQRLGIACSLIHNPDLIILDEPANGLDPQGILDLRNLILQLKNDMNKSVLISSHLLNEIEQVADNLAIIHKGKNMIQGSVNELLSDKELIVEVETENGNALASSFHNTQFENEIITIAAKKIFLKTAKENIPILHRIAANTGIAIFSIQNKRKLEDYFFKLTQHD